jgi:hypothetical protein
VFLDRQSVTLAAQLLHASADYAKIISRPRTYHGSSRFVFFSRICRLERRPEGYATAATEIVRRPLGTASPEQKKACVSITHTIQKTKFLMTLENDVSGLGGIAVHRRRPAFLPATGATGREGRALDNVSATGNAPAPYRFAWKSL